MRQIADAKAVQEIVQTLAEALRSEIAAVSDPSAWALVGLRSRGDVLARRLAEQLKPDHVGTLDITLYRDDLSDKSPHPVVRTSEINFSVDDRDIVLVDDVLMTGRSIRAALQLLIDLGRPRRVWLCVLVDRGGRELPIQADFTGLSLESMADANVATGERIEVHLKPTDDSDEIVVVTDAIDAG